MSFAQRLGLAVTLPELRAQADWLLSQTRDIEVQDITRPEVLEGDWPELAREIRTLLEGHSGRLGIHGPFWQLSIAARDPAVRKLVQRRLYCGLDFAEMIGATHMVVHSPFDFFGHPLAVTKSKLDEELQRVHSLLQPVVEKASDQGCTLMIENIYDLNPAPLLTLVRSFETPFVRLSVDVGHAHLMTQRGGLPPQQWLTQAQESLGHIHLHDNDGMSDQHLAPLQGTIHWSSLVRALRDIPDDTRLIVETKALELPLAREWIEAQSRQSEVDKGMRADVE